MGIFRFDPFCGVDLDPHIQNVNQAYCCNAKANDSLHVVQGDVWEIPHPNGSSYLPLSLFKGDVPLGVISSPAPNAFSSFGFSIDSDSVCTGVGGFCTATAQFRLSLVCNGTVLCGDIIDRNDYASLEDFYDAIITSIQSTIPVTVIRNANFFTAQWYYTDVMCLCSSVLTTREFDSLSEMSCGLQPIIVEPATRCKEAVYRNLIQLQYANMCLNITNKIECIATDTHTRLTFPSKLSIGCYHLEMDGFGCTQNIEVVSGCYHPMIGYRNFGSQTTFHRIGMIIRNPQVKKTQEISKSTKGVIRKLYSTYERSYEMITDLYSEHVHYELAKAVESDEFQVIGAWDEIPLVQPKFFVAEETYKVNWGKTFPTKLKAQAEMVLLDRDYTYVNDFCNG